MSNLSCPSDSNDCGSRLHIEDPTYSAVMSPVNLESDPEVGRDLTSTSCAVDKEAQEAPHAQHPIDKRDAGIRRIIRNFTPSYVPVPQFYMIEIDKIHINTGGSSLL
jgi:hypothetical protein